MGGALRACRSLWARAALSCAVAALLVPVAGCAISQITSPFRSKSTQTSWRPKVTEERLLEAAKSDNGSADLASIATNCPTFDVWQRDKLLTVYEIGQVGDSLAIRYRGELTKTARECQTSTDRVIVKYGFAGRVLLGPRGKAGTVTLPLQVHVTDKTRNILTTQKITVPVNIAADNPVGYFSTVRDIPINLPPGAQPGDYRLFIAFDRTAAGAG